MKTTTRDIEQRIGRLRSEITATEAACEAADRREERERPGEQRRRLRAAIDRRQARLGPLYAQVHALQARLPAADEVKPKTMEALLCLLDHVRSEERGPGSAPSQALGFIDQWSRRIS